MSGGIILAERATSDIDTPAAGKINIFPDSAASDALSWKDSSGTVHRLVDTSRTITLAIPWVVDGGGVVITTGIKGELEIPFACTVTGWKVFLDQSGSIVFDIWKDTYANYPPTGADTITASAKPTVSSATKASGSPTGWMTSIAAGDILRFNVDSISTATRALLSLTATRTI